MAELMDDSPRQILLKRAWSLIDTPYLWNGKKLAAHNGLDCSGFVEECLKTAGILTLLYHGSKASFQQFEWFADRNMVLKSLPPIGVNGPPDVGGWLVYWLKRNKTCVCHVEIVVNRMVSIGARGNSSITSIAKSRLGNKGVKVRNIIGRPNEIAGFVNPFIIRS